MSLKEIAKETLEILEKGEYVNSRGESVSFLPALKSAVEGTRLYTPQQASELLEKVTDSGLAAPARFEVTDETTQAAACRLVEIEKCTDLVLLNYASARNPGGGFINGARAQEEDLSRCSGLYPCLLTQPAYYEVNRNQDSLLYTDHLIYSPDVPWFRVENKSLLDRVYLASVITAPAPNAGEVLRREPSSIGQIEKRLRLRAGMVLAVAREHRHRTLLLGAWGCGVFRNSPEMVADAFGTWLESPSFQGSFDRVVFAVYDPKEPRERFKAFQKRFVLQEAG